ncbi:hypothetical protein D3C81_1160450 [compost metagenome]
MGGTGIQLAVGLQRGVLVGQLDRVVVGWQVTRADAPGFLQLVHVLRGDLAQRRVAVAEFGATIGLPLAIRHLRCSAAHLGAFAAQLALDFTRVGELAGHCSGAGQHHGQAQQAGVDLGRVAQQRAARPRQQQHRTQGEPQGQARYQLPPVQAHFPQCPQGAAQQHQAVQAQGVAAQGQQQDAGQGEADAGDQVIQRTAQLAQFDTASQQGQAHQQQQHTDQSRQPAGSTQGTISAHRVFSVR